MPEPRTGTLETGEPSTRFRLRTVDYGLLATGYGLLLLSASPVLADQPFPRGPGFYFSPVKWLLVLVVYLAWIRTCWWVDQDCRLVGMPALIWNPVLLGCGALGMLLVWSLPFFVIGYLGLLVLYLAPTLVYVGIRNDKVPAEERVLTPRHLRQLANRYLKTKLSTRVTEEEEREKPIPIRFIGKSEGGRETDLSRVARAQESKGYRKALELIQDAIEKRATDIHLEPTRDEMTVRFRVDGILQAAAPFSRTMGDAVLNIFKVLADLDITERRKPQDGSFSAEVRGAVEGPVRKKSEEGILEEDAPLDMGEVASNVRTRTVDFRIATAGSVAGEKMVLRILDRSRQITGLAQLGLREKLREQIRGIVGQPHGMFIVCGPTGAGKSTTLYACLGEIDRFQKNVITVENPVEYHITNVTQIEINPKAGKTFATELRSILRQDPDVIYIGEVRDQETAEIACQAAQTGHMVFTTLHANDTVTALARLIELGVKPFMVASSVSAVLGQRLVRVLCPKCKVKYKPNPDLLRKANLPADKIKFFYRPPRQQEAEPDEQPGCDYCGGTGYRGRTGVFELLIITDRIRDLLKDDLNLDAIRQEAARNGMIYLQQDGMRQVIEGETSIDELLRVAK
jgi:type II secretory ATPase GspE/PulE/Tfp pilus assembly ATPase PilB-like protein